MFGGATLVRNGACGGVPLIAIGGEWRRLLLRSGAWMFPVASIWRVIGCCYRAIAALSLHQLL